jgi:hypothetical protein
MFMFRERRAVLLYQTRGMSGGSKNIRHAFLFNSEVYFRSLSVNVGRAKTARRFVDRLLWHTREIRSVPLCQFRGMSGGSKNITRVNRFHLEVYFRSLSVNVGRAKTARRFVDRLLWHTREIRTVLLHQARGTSDGSNNNECS